MMMMSRREQVENVGGTIDPAVVRSVVQMLQSLGIYETQFEPLLMADSRRFFTDEGAAKVDELPCDQFLLHVEKRLQQAHEMVAQYLAPSSRAPLVRVVEDHLFAPHIAAVVRDGAPLLLKMDKVSDMKRMHSLLHRRGVSADAMLVAEWLKFIK